MAKPITRFRNKHKDSIALVMATGPSLSQIDLSKIPSTMVTIGINDLPIYYDPDYVVALDPPKPDRKIYGAWKNSKATKFLNSSSHHHDLDVIPVDVNKDSRIVDDWDWLVASHTSSLMAIHLAVYMGCKNIILVGSDFGTYNGSNYAWEKETNKDGYKILYKFTRPQAKEMVNYLLSDVIGKRMEMEGCQLWDASHGDFLNTERISIRAIDMMFDNENKKIEDAKAQKILDAMDKKSTTKKVSKKATKKTTKKKTTKKKTPTKKVAKKS